MVSKRAIILFVSVKVGNAKKSSEWMISMVRGFAGAGPDRAGALA